MTQLEKQVDLNHYEFSKYVHKKRWSSMWHQLDEVTQLAPNRILEIGPGPGLFKAMVRAVGIEIDTLDLDEELNPTYLASATAIPLQDRSYDVVCAFQMLEHLPFKESLLAFSEMCRVSKNHVLISLPDAKTLYPISLEIPRIGVNYLHLPKPRLGLRKHEFDGQHYWEVNTKNYSEEEVVSKLVSVGQVRLIKNYRVDENPYHRFLLFKK